MDKSVKIKCPIGSEEITVEFLDPEELITTRRRTPDGRYMLVPRKETEYPKFEVSCPNFEAPQLADLPLSLKEILTNEGRLWCKKRRDVCEYNSDTFLILIESTRKL